MPQTIISADRSGNYPRGVSYPLIDLALDRIISVVDLSSLNRKGFLARPNAAGRRGLRLRAVEAGRCRSVLG